MRVIVPATPDGLHHRVLPALLRTSPRPVEVMPCTYTEAYFDWLLELWAQGETFVIVEQDIEVADGMLDGLADCTESTWCAHSYEVFAGDIATAYGGPYGLGLTRFSGELLQRYPFAVEEAGKLDLHPVHPIRSYAVMDSTLTRVLRGLGVDAHQHFPNPVHHHHYMREGAFIAPPPSGA